MVAGQPYTLSVPVQYMGAGATVELWGADKLCNASSELLWWSDAVPSGPETPTETMTYCATFTPTRAYSSVVLAKRMVVDGPRHTFQAGPMTACGEAGSCPGGATGHGLAPGAPLKAPIGPYKYVFGLKQGNDMYEFFTGAIGRVIVDLGAAPSADMATAVQQGVFRMDPADPFGDAWYCLGPGSTIKLVYDADRKQGYEVSFRNVTRACSGSGNGTVSISDSGMAFNVASSFGLPTGPTGFNSSACRYIRCWARYEAPAAVQNFFYASTPTSVGHSNDPITTPTNFVDTFLVRLEHGAPLQMACGTQGTVTYAPEGTTTMDASAMTAWATCPAAPASGASVDFSFKN
jgi:hypothetical protein